MGTPKHAGTWVNDVHAAVNRTRVQKVLTPRTEEELAKTLQAPEHWELPVAISGCRHSMGGQQFARDGLLLDMRQISRSLAQNQERGLLEVEAGIQWSQVIEQCLEAQPGSARPWTIAQKQTGADTFTLGGSVSSNVHRRGLAMRPLVSDIKALTLLLASGEMIRCSRVEDLELFRLAVGGYGPFDFVTRVTLRLVRRWKLQRCVSIMVCAEAMMEWFAERNCGREPLW